ncbi:reverse transcriptase [Lasius niger]|uniref:Reverse transcriptase n=1 Tax=Lasius niger TaxID=67767 RepID=A0A0J7KDX5_LASNI|nr:reverse transcriptase [Lasius niger]
MCRRWNLKKLDKDRFKAALSWSGFEPDVEDRTDIQRMITWLDRVMQEACDVTARIGLKKTRRQAYWWQDSVATLQNECIHARRLWQRAKKRRRRQQEEIDELGAAYKLKRKDLRTEIARLKSLAWQELISSIDEDPWGLPYRLVLRKLKAATSSLTELLDPEVLSELLDSLFPRSNRPDPMTDWSDFVWSNNWTVYPGEVSKVIRERTASSTKAPGPDGYVLTLWKQAPSKILDWIRHIFNECLINGVFPSAWKRANLVLIPKGSKPGAPEGRLPKVRPICLLDEIGKAFERIIAERILQWQDIHPDSRLAANQFGFTRGRSTCDALLLVKEITSRAIKIDGGFAFVITLDIRNAFNSIPWPVICRALRRKGFSTYICRILDSYLCDRVIRYIGQNGRRYERAMEAGVPQGSVLGPILWNISYDDILSIDSDDDNSNIICYADNTLIVVTVEPVTQIIDASVDQPVVPVGSQQLWVRLDRIQSVESEGQGSRDATPSPGPPMK